MSALLSGVFGYVEFFYPTQMTDTGLRWSSALVVLDPAILGNDLLLPLTVIIFVHVVMFKLGTLQERSGKER